MDERFPTRRHIADCPLLQSFDIIVLAIRFASSLLHAEALRSTGITRFPATMASSNSSFRFRVCEVSQVPARTFDTRPPALPRPLHMSYVVRRRTILASSNRRDWPADRDLHKASTHGSLALELMSSTDKTPAPQSPSARLIFLLTFRHLCEISSFQLTSSAKLVLAYPILGSV